MSLIHGSMGLIYFAHEWQPKFNESGLLDDRDMLQAVTAINRQITALAPVLNSPTLPGNATVSSDHPEVPVAIMMKQYQGSQYLFAVGMRDGNCTATFTMQGLQDRKEIEVLDENRTLLSINGVFKDEFEPYDVHLYRVK